MMKWVPMASDKQMCTFKVHLYGRCTKGVCTRTPDGVEVAEGDWATAAVWWGVKRRWDVEQQVEHGCTGLCCHSYI